MSLHTHQLQQRLLLQQRALEEQHQHQHRLQQLALLSPQPVPNSHHHHHHHHSGNNSGGPGGVVDAFSAGATTLVSTPYAGTPVGAAGGARSASNLFTFVDTPGSTSRLLPGGALPHSVMLTGSGATSSSSSGIDVRGPAGAVTPTQAERNRQHAAAVAAAQKSMSALRSMAHHGAAIAAAAATPGTGMAGTRAPHRAVVSATGLFDSTDDDNDDNDVYGHSDGDPRSIRTIDGGLGRGAGESLRSTTGWSGSGSGSGCMDDNNGGGPLHRDALAVAASTPGRRGRGSYGGGDGDSDHQYGYGLVRNPRDATPAAEVVPLLRTQHYGHEARDVAVSRRTVDDLRRHSKRLSDLLAAERAGAHPPSPSPAGARAGAGAAARHTLSSW